MKELTINAAVVIPKTVSISAQNPTQTELTNQGLQADGSNTETRTYEVLESALSDFIAQQLKAGSISDKKQVLITANNSGEGSVYEVSVTVQSLDYSGEVPYFEQSDSCIFKHVAPDKLPGGIVIPQ